MGNGYSLPQLDGASFEAVEYSAILDVAFVANDDGRSLVGSQRYAWGDIHRGTYPDISNNCGSVVHISCS
jgi:hypothetical protein